MIKDINIADFLKSRISRNEENVVLKGKMMGKKQN